MSGRQSVEVLESHPHFESALSIVKRLAEDGHLTVLAGGCVRDALLGRVAKDLDLATSAPPEAVEAAFPKTLAVGKAFGTIVVVIEDVPFEVTTFRRDGKYLDGRHPEAVEFSDITEDAKRRDFTVNALFYDPLQRTVIDKVGGVADLKAQKLRAVGIAAERFQEDRLRMLRAVRFVAQLGFDLDNEAKNAITAQREALAKVSVERVFNEMKRLLSSDHLVPALEILLETELYRTFWPELSGFKPDMLSNFPQALNWEQTFASILAVQGQMDGVAILKRWKAPRESQRKVQELLEGAIVMRDSKTTRAARARIWGGEVYAELANVLSGLVPEAQVREWLDEYLEIAGPDGRLPAPFIRGQDLQALGASGGPRMGEILKQLFEEQLDRKLASREHALARAQALLKI